MSWTVKNLENHKLQLWYIGVVLEPNGQDGDTVTVYDKEAIDYLWQFDRHTGNPHGSINIARDYITPEIYIPTQERSLRNAAAIDQVQGTIPADKPSEEGDFLNSRDAQGNLTWKKAPAP